MSQILILRPDRAGDAIKSLPALRVVRREQSQVRFSVLASEHNASIFAHEPEMEIYCLPGNWNKLPPENWLKTIGLSSVFPAFEKVINLLSDPTPESIELLHHIPAKEKFSAEPPEKYAIRLDGTIHKLEFPNGTPAGRDETQNAAILLSQALWIDLTDKTLRENRAPVLIESDHQEALEKMGKKEGKWIGFCPCAGMAKRSQPIARWKKFFEFVTDKNSAERLFLFGTPTDYPKLMEIRSGAKKKEYVDLCFPTSFRTLGAYLKRLDGVVAVDSGPLHLARALAVPALGFLNGGDAQRWFPETSDRDLIVPRGWLSRHPGPRQVERAFWKWEEQSTL